MDTPEPSINLDSIEDDSPKVGSFFAPEETARLFISPALQQRLDLIDHLLEFGRQIVVLSGPGGSGKSRILDHLSAAKRANWCLIRLTATAETDEDALLEVLVHAMDIPVEDAKGVTLADMAHVGVEALARTGRVAVLMVDDAENLPPAAVAALTRLAHSPEGRAELKVLLAADLDRGALLETLQRADPYTGLVHIVEIPRLLEGQIREFIDHWLMASGRIPAQIFTDDDYERIATLTDGLPSNVLTLARQTLTERERMEHVPAAKPGAAPGQVTRSQVNIIFVALAIIALGGGAWWANQRPLEAPTGTETVELEPLSPPMAEERPSLIPPPAEAVVSVTPPGSIDPIAEAEPTGLPADVAITEPPAPASGGVMAEVPVASGTPVSPPESGLPQDPQTGLPPGVELSGAAPAPQAVEPLASTPAPVQSPEPVPAAPSAESPPAVAAAEPAAALKAPDAQPASIPTSSIKAPAADAPAPRPAPAAASARGLMGKPGTTHTLQLLGLSTRARAEAFRRERGITGQSEILESRLNGKPLFLIVYGSYPSRAAAQAALNKLPNSLSDTQPWARSVSSLRSVVR